MSFLAPLFLLGALAVALPVIFHLVRNTTRERTVFSSLMFLRPVPPRLTRRNRLEHVLLLVLRCGVLALLAAGFARPLWRSPAAPSGTPAAPARRQLLLVDHSASMRRSDLWPLAVARAEALLRNTTAADQVAVAVFDHEFRVLVSFEDWAGADAGTRVALVRERLSRSRPTWAATQLDRALAQAAEVVAGSEDPSAARLRQVVLLSDLQDGSHVQGLQGVDWPKGVALVLEPLTPKPTSNAGLEWLPEAGEAPNAAEPSVRVRVRNDARSRSEQFQLRWAHAAGSLADGGVEVHVPAGQSRIVALRLPPPGSGADRIVLQGDDEPFDNQVFLPPPEPQRLTVVYLGAESTATNRDALSFLRPAFQETRRQIVQLLVRSPETPLAAVDLEAASLVVVDGALAPAQAEVVRAAAGRGVTVLLLLSSPAAGDTLARLLATTAVEVREDAAPGYRVLAEVDFNHRVFAPFADPRYSDFSRIHFWKHRRLDAAALPGARVLARFDDGDPLLLECPIGAGRLLVLTSGWQPSESQLALSTKFVPWLYSMVELGAQATGMGERFAVGDAVPLAAGLRSGAAGLRIQPPAGPAVVVGAEEGSFVRTAEPGLYRLVHARGTQHFVVNLDPAESRLTPLGLEDFERLGLPVRPGAAEAAGSERPRVLRDAEIENRQKLWRWLLVAALGVLVVETGLAGRLTRQRVAAGGTSA